MLTDTNGVTLPAAELERTLLAFAGEVAAAPPADDGALLRFTALFGAAPIGIALADPSGVIVEANAALAKLLGAATERLLGRHLAELAATPQDAGRLRAGLERITDAGDERRTVRGVHLDHRVDGGLITNVTLASLPGDQPGTRFPVLMAADADDLHLLGERLLHQNLHDPLTGLPNGAAFTARLEAALAAADDGEIALVYLDVDGFRVVNDGLGTGVADQVLKKVAGKLNAVFGGPHEGYEGYVARLSGDGFAALLRGPQLTRPHAVALVDRALADLNEPDYLDGQGIGVSASAGIVVRPAAEGEHVELLRAAELALHRAKEAGKAQWMLFDPQQDAHDRSRYQLGAVIAGALENGEFSLIYQPTVKLAKPDEIAAVNAGLRWHHPEQGELDSAEFYPLAQTTGMTVPLGRWLLAESLAATARWRDRYGDAAPDVCIRLPKRLATDPDLVLLVKEQLDRHALPARALRLCTDRESMFDGKGEVLDSFTVLADLGAQLVLTISGSSDLELIPRFGLPVRHVILSGAVIDALAEDPAETDVRHLGQLVTRAKELNLRIGAEGVRSAGHAQRLRELGVLAARGAFVTDSATGDEVDEMIERHAR
ncbi:EAL domain-containing protein [Amycolatopsis jiangsuensis]|uniref:Diguanylate cyclase (GGDEF)-like protein/PAS domain S-box-containing protein n=1 Tax=Amycolatopsis jiangsuensis TaxID=1181879 RepID=A0A840ISW3_9PSEU|nr:EAL domain-containing protein [Amycolatopsis jiangsuensis]MBB4684545.1 diguanylate cyclase (GGDEF)-like protein/PAS domain S-box-containing protein [Amycolatopsis jiangsuensis]